jgi:hypothetical protein
MPYRTFAHPDAADRYGRQALIGHMKPAAAAPHIADLHAFVIRAAALSRVPLGQCPAAHQMRGMIGVVAGDSQPEHRWIRDTTNKKPP